MDEFTQVRDYLERQETIKNYETDTNTNIDTRWINHCKDHSRVL